jgi:citrate lyase subunit beta/citryl-CoA lyase
MRVLAAARAAGIAAIDFPFPDYQDPGAYGRSCDLAGVLGFDGKWCIHPSQVPIANARFTPTEEEVEWALRASHAYREAEEQGTAAISVDGMLVDAPHMRHVNTILGRAGRPV